MEKVCCIKCGQPAVKEAVFCHHCGTKLQVKPKHAPRPEPEIELPELTIDPANINLIQETLRRVWLLNDGFEKLHEFVRRLCAMVYRASADNSFVQDPSRVVDLRTGKVFDRFASDLYPPDGYRGLFIIYTLYDPTTENVTINGVSVELMRRKFDIVYGEVVPDPYRSMCYANKMYPRKRDSSINHLLSIRVSHEFKNGHPTLNFYYQFTSDDVRKPECKQALKMLGLKTIGTKGLKPSELHSIPGMTEALTKVKAEEIKEVEILDEDFDEYDGRWKPKITQCETDSVLIEPGYWSELYLAPTSTIHTPPPNARDLSGFERFDFKDYKPLWPRE